MRTINSLLIAMIALVAMSPTILAADTEKKTDYVAVENGQTVWLNPGEAYVPGSLRTISYSQGPSYFPQPSYYAPSVTYNNNVCPTCTRQPIYPAPLVNQPAPIYHNPPNNGYIPIGPQYDYGPYGYYHSGGGVKSDSTDYRNWTERRGAMQRNNQYQFRDINAKKDGLTPYTPGETLK